MVKAIEKRAKVVYKGATLQLIGVYDREEETLSYIHPITNQKQQNIEQCFAGWSEENEEENIEWKQLTDFVKSDEMLLQKIFDDIKEIIYV